MVLVVALGHLAPASLRTFLAPSGRLAPINLRPASLRSPLVLPGFLTPLLKIISPPLPQPPPQSSLLAAIRAAAKRVNLELDVLLVSDGAHLHLAPSF